MILAKGTAQTASMPLSSAANQSSYLVDKVAGPDALSHRLNELGFVSGARFSVVSGRCGGRMVVKLGGSRLALSRDMAENIWVK